MSDFPNDEAFWASMQNSPEFQERITRALGIVFGEKMFGEEQYWKLNYLMANQTISEALDKPKTEIPETTQIIYEQFLTLQRLENNSKTADDFIKAIQEEDEDERK